MLALELTCRIDVPRLAVWELVSDVRRQREFVAHTITSVEQTNATDLGPYFRWQEKGVLLEKRYECACEILGWEPPEWICFGSKNLFRVSYELVAHGGPASPPESTEVCYGLELPQTRPERTEPITAICRQSLQNLKTLLELQARSGNPEAPASG